MFNYMFNQWFRDLNFVDPIAFLIISPPPSHIHTAEDAQILLSLLFQLCVRPTLSCTSELMKAVEACTSHTFK